MSLLDPITVHPMSLQPTEAWDDILNKPGPLQPQVMRYKLLSKQCDFVFFWQKRDFGFTNFVLHTNLFFYIYDKNYFFFKYRFKVKPPSVPPGENKIRVVCVSDTHSLTSHLKR